MIANQPWYLGGVIDADAAQKAAKFVRTCNSYGVPLVVLVDTPGFLPGTKQEGLGVIRHGAKLLHAFAEAVVPKVTVVLRKAYGGGFIYDELEGSRRRPRARMAGRPDRDHGAEAGRRHHAPARDRRGRGPGKRARPAWPTNTPQSTCQPSRRHARASSTSSSRPRRRAAVSRVRWPALSGAGEYGNGGGNIPL